MKRKKINGVLLLIGLISCVPCWGVQLVQIQTGACVHVNAAMKGLTRIEIQGEAIDRLHGLEGRYTHTFDKRQGVVYVLPAAGQTQPFSVFVSTAQGHTYALTLRPVHTSIESVLLLPSHRIEHTRQPKGKASAYDATLLERLKAMIEEKPLPDVFVQTVHRGPKKTLGAVATARLVRQYLGANWLGEVWDVKNETTRTVSFSNYLLYRPGVQAIALSKKHVKGQAHTRVYRLIWRRN